MKVWLMTNATDPTDFRYEQDDVLLAGSVWKTKEGAMKSAEEDSKKEFENDSPDEPWEPFEWKQRRDPNKANNPLVNAFEAIDSYDGATWLVREVELYE